MCPRRLLRSAAPALARGRWLLDRLRAVARTARPTSLADAAATVAFAAVVCGVVVTGYLQGRVAVAVPTPLGPGSVVFLEATVACLSLSATYALSNALLFGQVVSADRRPGPTVGPAVTAVVPVHRDAAVLHRSVESLLASRYEDLRVLVVAEPGDTASLERARGLAAHDRVELLVNTASPGSKAGAVNYAASVTDTPYLGVFDADERVDPWFLPAAVAGLADADVVQGRTVPEPTGPVETVAYYESVLLADLSDRLLSALTGFEVAASRTVLMRRSAFEAVGGYDPAMLTEDFAFAFDCYAADLEVTELFAHASTTEAAHTVADWWGQRKRWMTGYAQVFHRLLGDCRAPDQYRTLVAPLICGGSVLGNLFVLSLLPKVAVLLTAGAANWLALPLLTLVGTALALRLYDARAGLVESVGLGYLLTPAVLPLFGLAGVKAIVEYLLTWEGEWYSVAKGA